MREFLMTLQRRKIAASAAAVWLAAWGSMASPAGAVTIELKDAAPERVENQRQNADGDSTLPGTPDLKAFTERLTATGQSVGNEVFLRIFKAEAELELWMRKGDRFELFATYPVCNWSGTLGPKLAEGDKQTPEGFYTISRRQLHRIGRWPRSLNLGFPNVYDQSLARTGSYILVHGGCSSVGCFAMTNPVIEEIFRLTQAAIIKGQPQVPVHVFPFRMTNANLEKHAKNEWHGFWQNLKEGYDAFAETQVPPRVRVCDGQYQFDRVAPGEGGANSPLEPCGATVAALQALDEFYSLARQHPLLSTINFKTRKPIWAKAASQIPNHLSDAFEIYRDAMLTLARAVEENAKLPPAKRRHPRMLARAVVKSYQFKCNPSRASCRRFMALHNSRAATKAQAAQHRAQRRMKTATRGAR
ncbi:MAG: murein L,D-transpeptidase [Hyphomicrobiaceae bacterium]|nr:murein L,D-transpeptidase [Hyphomicrobiaceae bacterium]